MLVSSLLKRPVDLRQIRSSLPSLTTADVVAWTTVIGTAVYGIIDNLTQRLRSAQNSVATMTHDDMSASTHQTSLAESRPIGRRIVFKPDYAHGSDCGTKASIDLIQLDYCDERKFTAPRRDTQLKFDAGGGSDTHTLDYIADLRPPCAQYTPPTQLNSTVESRRRRRCVLGFS